MSPNQVILQTPRLVLRGALPTDVQAFHEVFSDEQAMRYGSRAVHESIEPTEQWVQRMVASENNGVVDFAICIRPTDEVAKDLDPGRLEVIGKAGIWGGSEIGFILNRKHWGKGYAYEAIHAVVETFWQTRPDELVIKADVDPRNDKCIKLLQKLGFVEVGRAEATFYTHLGWCDSIYLELKRAM